MALARVGSFMSRRIVRVDAVRGLIRASSIVSSAGESHYASSTVPVSSVGESRQMPLPWKFHSFSGFRVATKIEASLIPGAGLGRFTTVPVKSGEFVRCDPIVSVRDYVNVHSTLKDTVAIEMKDGEDMDGMIEHWMKQGASQSEVCQMMSWFMAGVPAERTDRQEALVYVLAHSFHTNHGHPSNMKTIVEDGNLYHVAARDIAAGEELVLDYLAMGIQPFAKEWCAKHGLKDVQTLGEQIEALSS